MADEDAPRLIQLNVNKKVVVVGDRGKKEVVPDTVAFHRAAASGFYFPKFLEWYGKMETQACIRKKATRFLLAEIEVLSPVCFDGTVKEYLRTSVSGDNVYNLLQVAELLTLAKETDPNDLHLETILEHQGAESISLKNVQKGLSVLGRTCHDREEVVLDIVHTIRGSKYKQYRPHNPLKSTLGVAAIETAMANREKQPGRGGHPILVVATIANAYNVMRDIVSGVVRDRANRKILDEPFGLSSKTKPQIRAAVKNLANLMLYFAKQLSEVSRVEEITIAATACMHMVNVLPSGCIAGPSDPPYLVPLLARSIDASNGSLIERSDEDAPMVVWTRTPKLKPNGAKAVTHHVSYRHDLPEAFNGPRTSCEVFGMAVKMGVEVADPTKPDKLRMPSPYIGMSASALLKSLNKSYVDGGLFDYNKGLTLYGMRYKAAQAAVYVGDGDEKKIKEILDALKPFFKHNDDSTVIAESYALAEKCIDVMELPTKKEMSHTDDAIIDGIKELTGDRLKSMRVPQERFASKKAIDASIYFLHDMRDQLKAQLDKAGPVAAAAAATGLKKRKRSAPPPTGAADPDAVLRDAIASAHRSFSSVCSPDLCFSESDVKKHKQTLEECRLNTWNKLHKFLQSYRLRFDIDRVDLRLCTGVQLPEKIKATIEKAFTK